MTLAKMNKLVNKLSDQKFEYGKNDCFMFSGKLACAWHDNPTYNSYFSRHQVYKNEDEAREYMAKHGGIEKLITGTLGYPVRAYCLRDGDLAIAEVASGEIALGFVFKKKVLFKMEKGLITLPLKKCLKGWRL